MMIYIYKVPHLHDDTIKIPRLLVNEMHVCKLATEMKLKVNRIPRLVFFFLQFSELKRVKREAGVFDPT